MGLYDIDQSNLNKNTYIEAGIRENLELTEVVYKPTETSEFLAFYFKDDNGDKLSHTEWPMKLRRPLDQMSDEEKSQVTGLIDRQKKLVFQIVSAILGEDIPLKGSNFKEFAENVVKLLEGKYQGVKLRAKVVYDFRGFTSLANNPNYRFIEPMTVSKEESEIRILSSDKLVRPNQRNDNKETVDELGITNSNETKDENPF